VFHGKRLSSVPSIPRAAEPILHAQESEPRATRGELAITYLSPLLAVLIGIIHAGLAPVIVVADVKPNLVLVAVVLVTCLFGFLPGLVWAFVGGLTANLLVTEPLGTIPMALLVAAAVVAGGQRLLGRAAWVYPIVAAIVASVVADIIGLVIFRLVAEPVRGEIPLQLILPAAVLNAALVGLLLVPARLIAGRALPEEASGW
jgi:cell shape-determining protein MreD